MMKFYQEITLFHTPDISMSFLWGKLFMQLHIAFVEAKRIDNGIKFGISFPYYDLLFAEDKGENEEDGSPFTNVIRIFADKEEDLQTLQQVWRLQAFEEYLHIKGIRPVPEKRVKGYATYSRYPPDESVHQKAKRFSKRHEGVTYEEALSFMKQKQGISNMPYIRMRSLTSKQSFSLFIKKTLTDMPKQGRFNAYGLSVDGTVPEF